MPERRSVTHDSSTPGLAGFSILPNWMLADERVTLNMLAVYVALASYADQTGLAYPGIPALAKRAKMGTTAAREAIRGLEALGVVSVMAQARQNGGQTSNLYRIAVHERGLTGWPTPPTPGVGAPLRQALGAPPSGVDEQDPMNYQPPSPPSGGTPHGGTPVLEGLDTPPQEEPDHFALFWAAYPRKTNRPAAVKAWTKAMKGGTHWSLIVGGAAAYAEDPNREAAFTKHPATWLNGECWNDDPLPERVPAGTYAEPHATMPAPVATMSERVLDCAQIGRTHRMLADGTCMLCEVRATG